MPSKLFEYDRFAVIEVQLTEESIVHRIVHIVHRMLKEQETSPYALETERSFTNSLSLSPDSIAVDIVISISQLSILGRLANTYSSRRSVKEENTSSLILLIQL